MTHDPHSELRDDDEQVQRLFEATASMPSSDQVERLLEHARRAGGRTASRETRRSWVRRWWPVLVPSVAGALGLALLIFATRSSSPMAPVSSVAAPGMAVSSERVAAGPEQPLPAASPAPDSEDPDEGDDSLTLSEPPGDDDWDDFDDLELLHPPTSEPAQRAWLKLMEDDLAGGG